MGLSQRGYLNNMSDIELTSFQDGIKNKAKHGIHRKMWEQILPLLKSCKPEDITLVSPISREFDDILNVKGKVVNMPLEYKIDYRTFNTGNLVFELAPVIPDNLFSEEFRTNIRIPVGDYRHSMILDFIDLVNGGKFSEAKGSRHFLSKARYQFCYAVSKEDVVHTNSVKDIAAYYVFDSLFLSRFIRGNYRFKDVVVTKTKNDNSNNMWYTVSMLVSFRDLPKDIFFLFNSDGTRIKSSN
jgi:hypothetical protein